MDVSFPLDLSRPSRHCHLCPRRIRAILRGRHEVTDDWAVAIPVGWCGGCVGGKNGEQGGWHQTVRAESDPDLVTVLDRRVVDPRQPAVVAQRETRRT